MTETVASQKSTGMLINHMKQLKILRYSTVSITRGQSAFGGVMWSGGEREKEEKEKKRKEKRVESLPPQKA